MTDTSWIELADPLLLRRARWRYDYYRRWVREYDSLSWWGKFLKRERDFVSVPVMRELAACSLDDHIEFCRRHPDYSPVSYWTG